MADIPNNVLRALEIIFVENVDEVLKVAILPSDDVKESVTYEKKDFAGTQEVRINAKKKGNDELDTFKVH